MPPPPATPSVPLVLTDGHEYSYAEIEDTSRRIAAGLIELGVAPGDHVAMVVANYPEFVAVKFGIARTGATAIPVNYLFRAAELKYVLDQSEAGRADHHGPLPEPRLRGDPRRDRSRLGAGRRRHRDPPAPRRDRLQPGRRLSGRGSQPRVPGCHRSRACGRRARRRDRSGDPDGYSDILYTSGTTGAPKGVLITHQMVLRTAYGAAYNRALPDGHRMLFALPMYHVFGYIECLLASMFVGGRDRAVDGLRPRRHAAGDRPTASQRDHLRADDDVGLARRGARGAISTSARCGSSSPPAGSPPIRSGMTSGAVLTPEEVTTGYGMTETTAATTCTLPEGPDEWLRKSNGRLRDAGVAGDPELGGKLAVYKTIDLQTGADLPPGERGELLVRGPIVTPGYFNKPEETEAAFAADGWLRTGDIGTIDAEGYLKLTGRLKESYRCGGEMVMPKEVEIVLDSHPAVEPVPRHRHPDERMGEVGCAYVVPAAGAEPGETELIDYCRERLARFKVPRHVIFIAAADLPVTATGRVQKFPPRRDGEGALAGTAGDRRGLAGREQCLGKRPGPPGRLQGER